MSNTGTAIIDFGAFPGSNEASVVITGEASILGTSKADAWIPAIATSDHDIGDHAYARLLIGVAAGAPGLGVGFTIYARCTEKLTGTFNVNWAWL